MGRSPATIVGTGPHPYPLEDATVNPDLAWAIDDVKRRAPVIARRRRYYEGEHPTVVDVNSPTLSPFMRDLLTDLSDNLCDDVVDEPVDRLAIQAFTSTVPGVAETVTATMEANRFDTRLSVIFRDAWLAGDGYAIVEQDPNGDWRFYRQQPEQMAVRYSALLPDLIQVAAKVWQDGKRWRVTLYYGKDSDGGARVEKYASKGTSPNGIPEARAFRPLEGQDDQGEPNALQGADWDRVPVFHFPADEVGCYGRSVLTDVIPLQDLLNKSVADLVTAMEDVALPQRFATGIQAQYNDDGSEKPLYRKSRSALEIIRTAATEAQFGQFDGADLSQFLAVQESWRSEIARKGYLPPHSVGLGGETPTGISLLVTEGRQIKRVKNAQRNWGWVVRDMAAYMASKTLGRPVDVSMLDLEWERPETRDDQAMWELLLLKRDLGVPDEVILTEGGYDADEVKGWLEDKAASTGGRNSQPGEEVGTLGGLDALLPVGPVGPAGAPQPALEG